MPKNQHGDDVTLAPDKMHVKPFFKKDKRFDKIRAERKLNREARRKQAKKEKGKR